MERAGIRFSGERIATYGIIRAERGRNFSCGGRAPAARRVSVATPCAANQIGMLENCCNLLVPRGICVSSESLRAGQSGGRLRASNQCCSIIEMRASTQFVIAMNTV